MASTTRISGPQFFAKIIGSGFSLTKMQAKDIAVQRGASPADTLANFEAIVGSTKHPPGPIDTWLGEVIVHAQDIRRPLGIDHTYPTDATVRVANFYQGSNLVIGARSASRVCICRRLTRIGRTARVPTSRVRSRRS